MTTTGWGHSIYFWESSAQRALEFAQERAAGGRNSKGKIDNPFVLGAIIDLGLCLNQQRGLFQNKTVRNGDCFKIKRYETVIVL